MAIHFQPVLAFDNATNTAGEEGTLVSSAIEVGPYGLTVYASITNAATAPTTPGTIHAHTSIDGTTYYTYGSPIYGGSVNAGTVTNADMRILPGQRWVKFSIGGNDDQDTYTTLQVGRHLYGGGS